MSLSKNKCRFCWVLIVGAVVVSVVFFYKNVRSSVSQADTETTSLVAHDRADDIPFNIIVSSNLLYRSSRLSMLPSDSNQQEDPLSSLENIEKVSPDVIPDEYVLSFRNENEQKAFIEAARSMGIKILETLHLGNSVRIKVDSRKELDELMKSTPEPVEWSSNHVVKYPEQGGLEKLAPESGYQPFGNQTLKWLGLTDDNSTWGKGVTIAILDTGMLKHTALNEDNITRINLLDMSDSNAGEASIHGTAVASLIAGGAPDFAGIAPASSLLSIKVLNDDGGNAFTLARGIVEAVDRGASIINISLGTSGDSYILRQAVDYAVNAGAMIVAAAGNDSVDSVSYPARYENVIAVGAVDGADRHLYFSNRGEEIDLSAPGFNVAAAGGNDDLIMFSGTSAAVPLVSATLAWLISENPDITVDMALNYMLQYTDDAGPPGEDDMFGAGVLNLRRIKERDVVGIYDVAVGTPYVDPLLVEPKILFYFQNTGTEQLPAVDMKVLIDGIPSVVSFYNIGVGETVSTEYILDVNDLGDGKAIDITCSVVIDGFADANPFDNTKTCRVLAIK